MTKQRNTVQRQLILDTLKKLGSHPTIDEIYAVIHEEHPSISKTTVYRNLRQLSENGIISHVTLSDGLERYEERLDQHYHFRCKGCDEILDIDIGYLADIDDTVQDKYGVQIDKHYLVFRGSCPKCRIDKPK